MNSRIRGGGRLRRIVLATGLAGAWAVSASICEADGGPMDANTGACPICHQQHALTQHAGGYRKYPGPTSGTLGYGPPGIHPGFQGFGLGFHPGYGYGGQGRGTGAEGGYPFYGGPGYPHPEPRLKRAGGINRFPFYGGPGGPGPGGPNYFGPVPPLAGDQPVVVVEDDPRDPPYPEAYGCFTGMVPYPETAFAPFVTIAATGGSRSGVSTDSAPNAMPNTAPAPGELLDEHAATRPLGVDAEAVDDPGFGRGLKVTRVYPGSAAETAGLRVDDVIHTINGYRMEQPSHLGWIIATAAPDRVLRMSVRTAAAGELRTITARLP